MAERRLFRVNENLKYDNNRFADNNTFTFGVIYNKRITVSEIFKEYLKRSNKEYTTQLLGWLKDHSDFSIRYYRKT